MPVSLDLLQECEDYIARGRPEAAITKLLAAKEETGYKSDVLVLSARWQTICDEEIDGTLSNEEISRKRRGFNKDALRLLNAMTRERKGEKVRVGLLDKAPPIANREFSFAAMSITALIVAGIAAALVFAWQYQPEKTCPGEVNLNGTWLIEVMIGDTSHRAGEVNITQDICESDFVLSGKAIRDNSTEEVDFSARIGVMDKGEILFIYENFAGERGICRGVTPKLSATTFTMRCVDLIGFDKDGEANSRIVFTRSE